MAHPKPSSFSTAWSTRTSPTSNSANDACAKRLAGVDDYVRIVTRNLQLRQASGRGFIVRHLLLPGHAECCYRPILEWLGAQSTASPLQSSRQLHAGVAGGLASRRSRTPWNLPPAPSAARLCQPGWIDRDTMSRHGRGRARTDIARTDGADDERDITEITIQPDGRIYVFGASRQILDVLAALRSDDPKLQRLIEQAKLTDPVQLTPANRSRLRRRARPPSAGLVGDAHVTEAGDATRCKRRPPTPSSQSRRRARRFRYR